MRRTVLTPGKLPTHHNHVTVIAQRPLSPQEYKLTLKLTLVKCIIWITALLEISSAQFCAIRTSWMVSVKNLKIYLKASQINGSAVVSLSTWKTGSPLSPTMLPVLFRIPHMYAKCLYPSEFWNFNAVMHIVDLTKLLISPILGSKYKIISIQTISAVASANTASTFLATSLPGIPGGVDRMAAYTNKRHRLTTETVFKSWSLGSRVGISCHQRQNDEKESKISAAEGKKKQYWVKSKISPYSWLNPYTSNLRETDIGKILGGKENAFTAFSSDYSLCPCLLGFQKEVRL